jgi:predicted phosphodiesterase
MPNAPELTRRWTFIHLSDIHFRARLRTGEDVYNKDIRDQLLIDLSQLRRDGQHVNAVLVSGDVAFSGKPDEYEEAREFLNAACGNLQLPQSEVWMIPGNHDIDRSAIQYFLKHWHAKMKNPGVPNTERQRELDTVLSLGAKECEGYLLSTLKAYNEFARSYQCESSLDSPLYWETPVAVLDHGVAIKLRGVNSAFLCNENDVLGPTSMIGGQQMMISESVNTVSIVMCHHPQTWLADGTEFMRLLRIRSHVALFGHEHAADVIMNGQSMTLHAGAVNPERNEHAVPSYNIVTLSVNSDHALAIEVQRRVFSQEQRKFVRYYFPGETATHCHTQPLKIVATAPAVQPEATGSEAKAVSQINEALVTRRLTFFLLDLNEGARIAAVNSLELFTPEMDDLDGRVLYFAVIDEAKKRRKLLDLWHEVAKRHLNMPSEPDSGGRDA